MAIKNDMYTGDEYLKKNPGYHLEDAGWKADLITAMLYKNGVGASSIVDIGCGAGGVIRELATLMESSVSFAGFDISDIAIALARESAPANAQFERGSYFDIQMPAADLFLVIDLLEHLDDYYHFLRALKQRGGKCIFHIPLDLSSRSVLKPHILKEQRASVGHIHYFTRDMVWWMLEDTGFVIKDWRFTKPVTDLTSRPTMFRTIKKILRNISFSINQDLSAKLWGDYSVLILAE